MENLLKIETYGSRSRYYGRFLIKNPGGGLALTGGYIAGTKEAVEKASYRMTTPG